VVVDQLPGSPRVSLVIRPTTAKQISQREKGSRKAGWLHCFRKRNRKRDHSLDQELERRKVLDGPLKQASLISASSINRESAWMVSRMWKMMMRCKNGLASGAHRMSCGRSASLLVECF